MRFPDAIRMRYASPRRRGRRLRTALRSRRSRPADGAQIVRQSWRRHGVMPGAVPRTDGLARNQSERSHKLIAQLIILDAVRRADRRNGTVIANGRGSIVMRQSGPSVTVVAVLALRRLGQW